jgi:hypothetical protein
MNNLRLMNLETGGEFVLAYQPNTGGPIRFLASHNYAEAKEPVVKALNDAAAAYQLALRTPRIVSSFSEVGLT